MRKMQGAENEGEGSVQTYVGEPISQAIQQSAYYATLLSIFCCAMRNA